MQCGNCFNQKDMQIHTDYFCENLQIECENCEQEVYINKKGYQHNCFDCLKMAVKELRDKNWKKPYFIRERECIYIL